MNGGDGSRGDPTSTTAAAAGEPIPLPSETCPSCQSSTCHCFRPGASAGKRRRHAKAKLSQVWIDFNRALRSIEPFHTMHWIRVLFVSVSSYLYHMSRLSSLVETLRLDTVWRPLVPAFGIGLVLFVEVVYFTRLREHFVVRAWCKPCAAASLETTTAGYGEATCTVDGKTTYCVWDIVHSFFAVYLGIMIAFHYMCTTFASPGVVLSPILENDQNDGAVKVEEKWSCMDARGGCCFINPTLDVMYERRLVSMYPSARVDADESSNEQAGNTTNASDTFTSEVRYFPSPFRSFCKKCKKERPARAHHCSACNRCVLQVGTFRWRRIRSGVAHVHFCCTHLANSHLSLLSFCLSLAFLVYILLPDGPPLSVGQQLHRFRELPILFPNYILHYTWHPLRHTAAGTALLWSNEESSSRSTASNYC